MTAAFQHLRMADSEVFEVDGRDPFAARLDHVLGAVGDPHVGVGLSMVATSPVSKKPSSSRIFVGTL
jgi:hypothetical protein